MAATGDYSVTEALDDYLGPASAEPPRVHREVHAGAIFRGEAFVCPFQPLAERYRTVCWVEKNGLVAAPLPNGLPDVVALELEMGM